MIKGKYEENRVEAPGATRPSKKNHQGLQDKSKANFEVEQGLGKQKKKGCHDDNIEKMKTFLSSNAWRLLTLEDIQKGVWKNTYAGTGSEEVAGTDAGTHAAIS